MEYPGIPNFEWLRIVLNRVLKAGYSLLDSTLTLSCMNFCSLTFLETYVLGKKKNRFHLLCKFYIIDGLSTLHVHE